MNDDDLLELLGEDAPSDRMRARLRAAVTREAPARPRRRPRLVPIAAGVALAAALALFLLRAPRGAERPTELFDAAPLTRQRAILSLDPARPAAREALFELASSDDDRNVRLLAIDRLTENWDEAAPLDDGLRLLGGEASPLVQAHLVEALLRSGARPSEAALRAALAAPGLHADPRRRLEVLL